MHLDQLEEIHPNWDVIASMDREQQIALIDLTTALLVIDPSRTPQERSSVVHAIFDDCRGLDRATVAKFEAECVQRMDSEDSDKIQESLSDAASTFENQNQQMAALRLLATVSFTSETSEREIDYLYMVGDDLDLDFDTVDQILRSSWETRQGPVETQGRSPLTRKEHRERPSADYLWGGDY